MLNWDWMIKLKKNQNYTKGPSKKKLKTKRTWPNPKTKKKKLRGSFGWLGSKSDDEREKKKWIFVPNRRSFQDTCRLWMEGPSKRYRCCPESHHLVIGRRSTRILNTTIILYMCIADIIIFFLIFIKY